MENNIDIDEFNNEQTKFMGWIQSFSKRVVSVFSVLYVLIVIVMVSMLVYELRIGITDGLSTMITEINETFRVVIGGYLIKAAVENGFKITGTFLANINKIKLQSGEFSPSTSAELDSEVENMDEEV